MQSKAERLVCTAVVRNCLFEDSTGFFARWKSSHALMENNVFRGNGFPIVEMQVLPAFYEGPPQVRNVVCWPSSQDVPLRSRTVLCALAAKETVVLHRRCATTASAWATRTAAISGASPGRRERRGRRTCA